MLPPVSLIHVKWIGVRSRDAVYMRRIQGLILGSETNKVLTHSKLPVLVYR